MAFRNKLLSGTWLVLIIIVFCSFEHKTSLRKGLKVTARIFKHEKNENDELLSIKITLRNYTPDSLHYIVMSCYYPFFYKIVPDNFLIQETEDCDKNIPRIVSIAPHENTDTTISLRLKESIDHLSGKSFRLGVYLAIIDNPNDLLNGQNILQMEPSGLSSEETDLNPKTDTIFKIKPHFITEKHGIVKQFNSSLFVNFLWSNNIRF